MTTATLSALETLVLDTLKREQPANGPAIAKLLDLNRKTVNSLLKRMEKAELVYHVVHLRGKTNQPSHIYSIGINPNPRAGDRDPIRQPVYTSWKPNHRRDSLVAALFGEVSPA